MKILPVFAFLVPFVLQATPPGPNRPGEESGEDTLRIYRLPEVVITATRIDKDPFDVGRSVTIVSGPALDDYLHLSIGEAVARSEGLYVVGGGQNPGAIQSIFMRGANSNHTTVLIDDVRITDPSGVNNALDLSELTLSNVDQVEIVRGAHGTIYGSAAIGGVINLISKKRLSDGFHADAEVRSGVFGKGTSMFNQRLSLNYSDPLGFYLTAGVNNTTTNGIDATVDTVTSPNAFKNRDQDGFEKLDFTTRAGYQNDAWDVYVSFASTRHESDIDDGAFRDDDNHVVSLRRQLLTYGLSRQIGQAWKVRAVGGISTMSRLVVDDSSLVDAAGTTDQSYFDGTYTGRISNHELINSLRVPGIDITAGLGLYDESMGTTTRFYSRSSFGEFEFRTNLDTLKPQAKTRSLFLHAEVGGWLFASSLEALSLTAGIRLNRHSSFGNNRTFELGSRVRIGDESVVYASYSTGFNAPSLYQLFVPDRDFSSGITRGNPHLQPEQSRSFEVGIKYRLDDRLRVSAGFFTTWMEQAIEYVYLWDKNVGIDTLGNDFLRNDFRGDTYLNLGTAVTRGIEISVFAKLGQDFSVSGNLSILRGRLNYSPDDIDRNQTLGHHIQIFNGGAFLTRQISVNELVRRPNTYHLTLTYAPEDHWFLRIDLRHVGSRPDAFFSSQIGPYGALATTNVAEYTVVDFTGQVKVFDLFTFTARAENVFDDQYSEINGFRSRGRGLFVGLRYSY